MFLMNQNTLKVESLKNNFFESWKKGQFFSSLSPITKKSQTVHSIPKNFF